MEDIIDYFEEDENTNLKDWQLIVGEKSKYYIPRWLDMKSGKSKISFNVAAFFLGIFWMLYRKMYVASAIYFAIMIFLGFFEVFVIEELYGENPIFEKVANWISIAIIGFYGNYFYLKNTEKKILNIRNSNYSNELYEEQLLKQGDTSFLPPLIAVLALVIFGVIVFMLDDAGF